MPLKLELRSTAFAACCTSLTDIERQSSGPRSCVFSNYSQLLIYLPEHLQVGSTGSWHTAVGSRSDFTAMAASMLQLMPAKELAFRLVLPDRRQASAHLTLRNASSQHTLAFTICKLLDGAGQPCRCAAAELSVYTPTSILQPGASESVELLLEAAAEHTVLLEDERYTLRVHYSRVAPAAACQADAKQASADDQNAMLAQLVQFKALRLVVVRAVLFASSTRL